MAVVAGRRINQTNKYVIIEWLAIPDGDTGAPALSGELQDKTVQVSGTFGVGGSVTLEGSMNGTTWFPLTDSQDNAITLTAAGAEAIVENPLHIRPNVTAGDGATAIDVRLGASVLK